MYPWLLPVYHRIVRSLNKGTGHHALLIQADTGLGGEQLLAALTRRFMCRRSSGDEPCGTCHDCRLMLAGSHPDFYTLAPLEGNRINIDQIREINDKINQHAQQNGHKVVYIKGAELLTEAASNALLKTLEEPRPDTYFMLQSEQADHLLVTIYSRCQVWRINTPNEEMAVQWLRSQTTQETSEMLTALAMNFGRPPAALAALQQGLLASRKAFLRQFWLFYRRRSPLEILPLFDKLQVIAQLDWILAFLSDALKYKFAIQRARQCLDLSEGVARFSEEQSAIGLLTASRIMQKVRSDLLEINGVNMELILLDGLTRLITDVFKD